MLSNYLKIALRQFAQRKTTSFINVFGLSVGLAVCLLIGLYVQDELSYDRFHDHSDRVYRVLREFDLPDLQATFEWTPGALAEAIEQDVAVIEQAVRIQLGSPIVRRGDEEFVESGFLYADEGFFDLFSFPLIRGSAQLSRPSTMLISEAMAQKYFPGEDAVGQVLEVDGENKEITGILGEAPAPSHLAFDFVTALNPSANQVNWGINNFHTYLLLSPGASADHATEHIAAVIADNAPAREAGSDSFIPHLQLVTGIHFGFGTTADISAGGNMQYVLLFIALAVLVLILAGINFVNLATARSMDRAREVGLRKTLGAFRHQLIVQFLGEALMVCFVAFSIALALCWLALPYLNDLAGKSISFDQALFDGPRLLWLGGLVLLIGVVSGGYPALLLSRFPSIDSLKGRIQGGRKSLLRKGLVVFQFTISIAIIASTGVVLSQLQFMRSKALGFDAENVLVIDRASYLRTEVDAFKTAVRQIAGVERVSSGFSMPGTFFINSMWQPLGPDTEAQNMDYSFVDFDYVETLDMDVVAGRSFSRGFATDSTAMLLNETAVADFGWTPDEALGKQFRRGDILYTVIGVLRDFNYRSLHSDVYSLALFGPLRSQRYVAMRLSDAISPDLLRAVRSSWSQFTDLPFEYAMLEDRLHAQYESEQQLSRVFVAFSALALVIACLGLFGMTTYAVQKRRKEIGVRKVMGASIRAILGLLSSDFARLFALSFLIASPLAYAAMRRWLQDFAYRVDVHPGIFVLAGGVTLVVALAAVGYQTYRAAASNPIDSLRYE